MNMETNEMAATKINSLNILSFVQRAAVPLRLWPHESSLIGCCLLPTNLHNTTTLESLVVNNVDPNQHMWLKNTLKNVSSLLHLPVGCRFVVKPPSKCVTFKNQTEYSTKRWSWILSNTRGWNHWVFTPQKESKNTDHSLVSHMLHGTGYIYPAIYDQFKPFMDR